jgi:hypothetical protein
MPDETPQIDEPGTIDPPNREEENAPTSFSLVEKENPEPGTIDPPN